MSTLEKLPDDGIPITNPAQVENGSQKQGVPDHYLTNANYDARHESEEKDGDTDQEVLPPEKSLNLDKSPTATVEPATPEESKQPVPAEAGPDDELATDMDEQPAQPIDPAPVNKDNVASEETGNEASADDTTTSADTNHQDTVVPADNRDLDPEDQGEAAETPPAKPEPEADTHSPATSPEEATSKTFSTITEVQQNQGETGNIEHAVPAEPPHIEIEQSRVVGGGEERDEAAPDATQETPTDNDRFKEEPAHPNIEEEPTFRSAAAGVINFRELTAGVPYEGVPTNTARLLTVHPSGNGELFVDGIPLIGCTAVVGYILGSKQVLALSHISTGVEEATNEQILPCLSVQFMQLIADMAIHDSKLQTAKLVIATQRMEPGIRYPHYNNRTVASQADAAVVALNKLPGVMAVHTEYPRQPLGYSLAVATKDGMPAITFRPGEYIPRVSGVEEATYVLEEPANRQ